MNTVHCEGVLKVKSTDTSEVFEIAPEILDWRLVNVMQRSLGPERHYAASVAFNGMKGSAIRVTCNIWEYPEGHTAHTETEVIEGELIEEFTMYIASGESGEATS